MAIRHTAPGEPLYKKRKGMRRTKWNWSQARDMYVEGVQTDPNDPLALHWPTVEEVSKTTGIPQGTVAAKCSSQHWVEQRNAFIQSITIKRKRKRVAELAKEASGFDTNVLNISKLGIAIIAGRLAKIARSAQERDRMMAIIEDQMQRGQLVDMNSPALNPNVVDVDSKEMLDLAMAAQKFDDMTRRILGIIDPDEQNAGELTELENMTVEDKMRVDDPERLAVAISTLQNIGMGELLGLNVRELESGVADKDGNTEEQTPEEQERSVQDDLETRREQNRKEKVRARPIPQPVESDFHKQVPPLPPDVAIEPKTGRMVVVNELVQT